MKVRLYAAAVPGRVEWRFSLDIDMDYAYWFEQTGGKASLHLLEPVLSLSEACALLAVLNRKSAGKVEHILRKWTSVCTEAGLRMGPAEARTLTYAEYEKGKRTEESIDVKELLKMERLLAGRCFSKEELLRFLEHHGLEAASQAWTSYLQAAFLRGRVELGSGIGSLQKRRHIWSKPEQRYCCNRCGTGGERMYPADCLYCSGECLYCEECLTMGRVQSCTLLVYGSSDVGNERVSSLDHTPIESVIGKWGLSPAQAEAVKTGFAYITRANGSGKPGRFLIWAVTGAGKTEMIFPFIDRELRLGRKVLIATPRRDVVLELQPRLKRAFPDRKIVTLYGGSEERWEQGELTLATTHQLLRYYRSFDLVIVDEIDAFPYHNNPMLQFAAERVCRRSGAYVLLSATPPANLIRLANRGRLAHVKVPVRFHRHPLPVPRALRIKELSKWKDGLPANVKSALKQSIDRGAQLFVFVPRIRDVDPMVKTIRTHLSGYAVEGTSSQDPGRADKVTRFRQGDIRILVTTTILERGVTVPKTDVFILQADSATFDSAALIQMAGRSGRSKDDPAGRVFFAAAALTNAQARAIRQIRQMNRVAKRKGYLMDRNKEEGEKTAADRDNRTRGGL